MRWEKKSWGGGGGTRDEGILNPKKRVRVPRKRELEYHDRGVLEYHGRGVLEHMVEWGEGTKQDGEGTQREGIAPWVSNSSPSFSRNPRFFAGARSRDACCCTVHGHLGEGENGNGRARAGNAWRG